MAICVVNNSCIDGQWQSRKSMPIPAVFAGTAAGRDGKIYVISGSKSYDVSLTNAVRIYNPEADTWSSGAPIPTARTSPGIAVGPDGTIYVAGGLDAGNRKDALEAYSPLSNTWKILKPLPTPRDAPAAAAARGKDGKIRIYIMGGRDRKKRGAGMSVVEAYDPISCTWATMAPMPINLHAHSATIGPDGKIYVIGGTNDMLISTNAVQIYDPKIDTWTIGPPMPYGQECAAATFTPGVYGEILVIGGWDKTKHPLKTCAAYNPRIGKWRLLNSTQNARASCGAATITATDGLVHTYVIGGTGESGINSDKSSSHMEIAVDELVHRTKH